MPPREEPSKEMGLPKARMLALPAFDVFAKSKEERSLALINALPAVELSKNCTLERMKFRMVELAAVELLANSRAEL